jgi:mannose-1-phosphate guanylyltransferase
VRDGYLWNSGIFVWRAGDFLDELSTHTPEVAPHLAAHSEDLNGFFHAVNTPISVDVGVLERSGKVLVLSGDFGWDDVGTWAALRRVRTCDAGGNALAGEVHTLEARGNVVHADGGTVVLYGVSDLVVVSRDGLTLVTTVDKAADLKTLIDSLPASVRDRA